MDVIRTAIGLMSGTSMDGIDVALIRTDGRGFIDRGPFLGVPYEADFRGQLKRALELARPLTDRNGRSAELRDIELELTQRHAIAVAAFLERFGLAADAVDVLGFHGQTVLHRPDEGLTVQIGDGQELARQTGIPVVYDMRANDMVHGGQGAPLVPAYHAALAGKFQQAGQAVCFVNIGGISNLTFIGTDGRISAFDSGPGNTLIDQWVEMQTGKTYDPGGEIAGRGKVVAALAERYLDNPFFRGNVRRSLDRGDFAPLRDGEASSRRRRPDARACRCRRDRQICRFPTGEPVDLYRLRRRAAKRHSDGGVFGHGRSTGIACVDRRAGRLRWRRYGGRGLGLSRRPLAGRAAADISWHDGRYRPRQRRDARKAMSERVMLKTRPGFLSPDHAAGKALTLYGDWPDIGSAPSLIAILDASDLGDE